MESGNPAVVVRLEREVPTRVGGRDRDRWPRLTIESRPLGRLAPGAIRVRMLLAGVCGTDLHLTRADPETGYIVGSAPLEVGAEGRVLGHEGNLRQVGRPWLAQAAGVAAESFRARRTE